MASNMDSKGPLLPTGHREPSLVTVRAPWCAKLIRVLQISMLVGLLYLYWPRISTTSNTQKPSIPVPMETRPVYHNPKLNYTRRELLHFDIDVPAYWPITPAVSITESLGICHYSYAWNATGNVRIVPGDPEQEYNFMIGMDIAGSSQQAVDSVVWPIHSEFNAMYIRCVEFRSLQDAEWYWDAAVHLEVTIFVKPHTLQHGEFKITTNTLDIEIGEGLSYETNELHMYSRSGNIISKETEQLTAFEISAIAMNGSITGNWSLPRQITLRTNERNAVHNGIDIDLKPKQFSSGPATPGMLSATTQGGNIDIRMPFERNMLSLRNTSIDVHSQVGSISGSFVTGYKTSMSTLAGSLEATLLPYFQLQDTSSIYTSTAAGHTSLRMLPPIVDSYYRINPLKNTNSEHSTTSGLLSLRYPPQWVGAALGLSETGEVSAEGERFSTIVQEAHLVVARTDDEIASRLDFSTTTGKGRLVIE